MKVETIVLTDSGYPLTMTAESSDERAEVLFLTLRDESEKSARARVRIAAVDFKHFADAARELVRVDRYGR